MGRVGGELGGGDGHGSGLHPISQAGKFGLIPTLISLGTGAAWLGVVSVESVGKHAPSPLRHGWAPDAAPVGVFSRGTTRISGSLSCGAREVRAS